jgi:hypothetical protein
MSETLFEGFGEPTPKRQRKGHVSLPIEPLAYGWVVVRTRAGVYPFFHLVKCQLTHGSIATLCGLTGSALSNIGVDSMIRCPSCDIAEQLS